MQYPVEVYIDDMSRSQNTVSLQTSQTHVNIRVVHALFLFNLITGVVHFTVGFYLSYAATDHSYLRWLCVTGCIRLCATLSVTSHNLIFLLLSLAWQIMGYVILFLTVDSVPLWNFGILDTVSSLTPGVLNLARFLEACQSASESFLMLAKLRKKAK